MTATTLSAQNASTVPCPFCGHKILAKGAGGMRCMNCRARGPWYCSSVKWEDRDAGAREDGLSENERLRRENKSLRAAASAGVIAAAEAVIECDRAQVLTDEHIDALENAIAIQRGIITAPRAAASAQATPLFQERAKDTLCYGEGWRDVSKDEFDAANRTSNYETRIVYAAPQQPAQAGEAPTLPQLCGSCGNYVAIEADHEEWCSYLGWKKRALEAEALNRKFMASVNGPTHMGEPVLAAVAQDEARRGK